MSTPHIVLWCATVLGLLAAVRNPTSGALAAGWLANEVYWMSTGSNFSTSLSFCADITVLAVIGIKATVREGCRTYPTMRLQMICFWRAVTLWDKLVAGGYIFAWGVYVSNLHPYYAYWALFWIFLAQLLFADAETLHSLLGRNERRVMPNRPPGGLAFAGDGGRV